jgi:DNA mismatch repair protein MutS2
VIATRGAAFSFDPAGGILGRAVRAEVDHLQWHRIAAALLSRICSPVARERLGGQADAPLSADVEQVRRRFDELTGLDAAQAITGPGWSGPLRDVVEVADVVTAAERGSILDPPTLAALEDLTVAVASARRLRAALAEVAPSIPAEAEAFGAVLVGLADLADLGAQLHRSLDRSAADGEIGVADGASPALAQARARLRGARSELAKRADALVRRSDLTDALADRYWTEREGRVVVPVVASKLPASSAHAGIIHGSSGTGQTLFVEPPQLVEDNNRLRRAQMTERAEVQRVLENLSLAVGRQADALRASLDALVALDAVVARRRLGEDLGGRRPEVVEARPGNALSLVGVRHPLMVLAGGHVVPNDLHLKVGHTLIISGPNAGGKTVALKTVGLCVLLARAGVPVPAQGKPCIPLFRHLVTDVGDDQSIDDDLSTFSAHLTHVHRALTQAAIDGPGTLVLLDEVAAGTEPQQGAALAEAILVTLAARGASGVVTTHFDRLKMLPVDRPDVFVNAAVGFDLDALRPTFELRIGTPGSSGAIALARRLGLPVEVVEAAEAILGQSERDTDALLRQLEAERTRLGQMREALSAESAELSRERARLVARDQRELEGENVRRAKAQRAVANQLHALEDELVRQRKRLRDAPASEAAVPGQASAPIADARTLTRKAREQMAAVRPEAPALAPVEAPPAVGDRVHVAALGADGVVLTIKGSKATVQLPTAKMTVPLAGLSRPQGKRPKPPRAMAPAAPSASRASGYFGGDARPFDPSLDDVVDLRGQRADEAVEAVEVFLDRAIAADREVIVVRHGQGSGALRTVVREHLGRLGHVVTHRCGQPSEGGDAVTVVWVKA